MVSSVWQVGQRGRTMRLALLLTTAMGAAALATTPSSANNWIGTVGDWLNPANWDTGVPGAATTAVISNGGTVEIKDRAQANSQISEAGTAADSSGTVVISGTGSSWNAGSLTLGNLGHGIINLSSGGSLSTTATFVGQNAGSTGAVTLDGAGTTWTNSGFFALGYEGNGSLAISNGAVFNSSPSQIGYGLGTSGTVTVSGAGSSWIASHIVMLGVYGSGSLTISEGGTVNTTSGDLATSSGGSATLAVDGSGSSFTSTGQLLIGNLGTGSLTVSNGGAVSSLMSYVGYFGGSSGRVQLSGAGSTWTNSGALAIGDNGTGVMEVSGGATVSNTTGMIGDKAQGNGRVTISGAGSSWTNSNVLDIGNRGTGTLNIRDGGSVSVTSELGVLLANNGGTGTIAIGGLEHAAAARAGTLAANKIAFGSGTSRLVFNHTDTAYQFSTKLVGNGVIMHEAGSTVLTGDSANTFTGHFSLNGGSLVVGDGTSGSIGGQIYAATGTRLSGTGSLGETIISAGATHAPGNSIGTQTINGLYANNGTLQIEVGPNGADKVVVNGEVNLVGSKLDLQLASSGWDIANSPYVYTIIENDGVDAITGTFSYDAGKHLFLETSLDYAAGTGNDVALTIARNAVSFASIAGSDAQSAVAQAIENLGSGELYDAIVALGSQDLVQQSFEALSGQIHGSAGTTLVGSGKMLGQTANSRMQGSTEPAGAGAAPVLAYGPGGPELVAPDTKLGVVWSSGFGARGSQDGNTAGSTLDTGSAGIAAGMDGQFGDWRLGGLAGYSNSSFNAKDGNSTGGSNNYSVGLYGGTEWGDFAFRSSLAYTWHDVSTRRSVTIGGFTDQLSARYGAHALQASGELSYSFSMPGAARLEPFANLTHVRMATDGYSESGGAAALTNAATVTNTTFTTLGVRASQKFAVGTVLATVNAMVGWEHGMGDLTPKNTSNFAGGSGFTVTGTPAAADTALISTGVDLNINDATTLGLTYDGRFAKGLYNNGVTAKVKILF